MNNHRYQILYQKNEFNHHNICQLNGIIKCGKCRKNNNLMVQPNNLVQFCLFCGNPINITHESINNKNRK